MFKLMHDAIVYAGGEPYVNSTGYLCAYCAKPVSVIVDMVCYLYEYHDGYGVDEVKKCNILALGLMSTINFEVSWA